MKRGIGSEDAETPELAIPVRKVCFIIAKAHEFDVKVAVTEPDAGSNPTDDNEIAVLQDHNDDPVREELGSLISELSIDEQIDLVALTWLGRDDGQAAEWEEVRQQAAYAHNKRTARYLCGNPLLGDHLEAGLDALGLSCSD
ncbi:DUF3775 domain-containing protein [Mesorhizobium sp. M1C.F.Ca.ET.193.01.1.1]|uniref:DUF3775 domain-containing protein n=1 Tax=unclassified Mesorhizobium TaxID=325217 RepID=UPI000FD499EF|nr:MULTISPECIES: DUF3775 domain-containing protein [unclassified Mesorhizobium]TGS92256.1 DUF3775 domain-containing protein [bacterium M00.F.Ca.ET.177.01.1.1]TGQ50147.1 DUF3775 domain-containing protein [Mesorhizobium sp. M1C.F.Ca.ET.210.01.1.1]TGQ64837.1 DUF3775 domain-containing protein [Mesorhizobium sp. M1C.F.Ca.ET.212.01.1.1]TGQ98619.1 DUF3775 domain-containing protein [Mesorhizobium sp. M1C.F.Ca.ET.204.01.1.1]TGR18860.1 DUF3775 domain-containing protein [Mesorhizobium sp. M1C.F.Ca.ET.196